MNSRQAADLMRGINGLTTKLVYVNRSLPGDQQPEVVIGTLKETRRGGKRKMELVYVLTDVTFLLSRRKETTAPDLEITVNLVHTSPATCEPDSLTCNTKSQHAESFHEFCNVIAGQPALMYQPTAVAA